MIKNILNTANYIKTYKIILLFLFFFLENSFANVNFGNQIDDFANYVKQQKSEINSYQSNSEVLLIKNNIKQNKKNNRKLDKLYDDLINIKNLINKDGRLKNNYIQILKNKHKINNSFLKDPYQDKTFSRHYFGIAVKVFRNNILGNNDVDNKIKTIPEISYAFIRNYLYISPFLSMVKFYHKDNNSSYEIHQDYLYGLKLGLIIFNNYYLKIIPNVSNNYINYSITDDILMTSGNKNFKSIGLEGLININSKIYFRFATDYNIYQDKLFKTDKNESTSSKFITSIGLVINFN